MADLDTVTAANGGSELIAFLSDADEIGSVLVYVGRQRFVDLRGLRLLEEATALVRSRGGELLVVAPPRSLQVMARMPRLAADVLLVATPGRAARHARDRPSNCAVPASERGAPGSIRSNGATDAGVASTAWTPLRVAR